MRRTLSLIASDLRNAVRPTLPVVGMLAVLVAYIVATKMFLAARIDPDLLDAPTLADCLICAFAGVVPVGFVPGEDFVFPMDWFVVMLSLALVTLVYPERNLARVGGTIIAVGGGRAPWWISKCVWCGLMSFVSWAAVVSVCAALALALGGTLSLEANPDITLGLLAYGQGSTDVHGSLLPFALCIPFVVMALSHVQFVLSIFTGVPLALVATVGLIISAVYCSSPLVLGDYLMACRLQNCMFAGLNPVWGILLSLLTSVVFVGIGFLAFDHRDILPSRKDRL